MTTYHPVVSAFPYNAATSQDAIVAALAGAFPLVLAAADDILEMDFSAAGAAAQPVEVRVGAIAFLYDAADEVSAHDGVTVLVSEDGRRFIADLHPGAFVNVISIADAPPGGSVAGARHIVGAAPSGAFAANANDLAYLSGTGDWTFAAPVVGQKVFNLDEGDDRVWTAAGTWALPASLADGSILPARMFWPFGARVEKQTVTPPVFDSGLGTPALGTLYRVGVNAIDDFATHDGELAQADGAGGWTFFSVYEGMRVYDKAAGGDIQYSGARWQAAAKGVQDYVEAETTSGSTATGGSGSYTWSSSTAPTLSQEHMRDAVTITHAARNASARLIFTYRARLATNATVVTLALYRDDETSAVDWQQVNGNATVAAINALFAIDAGDTDEHTYHVRVVENSAVTLTSLERRYFRLDELAPDLELGGVDAFTAPTAGTPYVVADGVTRIRVLAIGAAGGGGGGHDSSRQGGDGGGGAGVEIEIDVTPGEILTVIVGPGGGPGARISTAFGNYGGGGGALTGLKRGASWLVIAGSGGGGAGSGSQDTTAINAGDGGPGGVTAGVAGTSGSSAGQGGTQSAGGAGGTAAGGTGVTGSAGSSEAGGDGGDGVGGGRGGANNGAATGGGDGGFAGDANNAGGGGGGAAGYFGGGGGSSGTNQSTGNAGQGGGGGSSYTGGGSVVSSADGSGATPGLTAHEDYPSGAGVGGAGGSAADGSSGSPGAIVIRPLTL